MAGGRLTADPLFQGLTRPPMALGVTYTYFAINAMICMVIFINTKSFLVFPLAGVIHGIGYMLCLKEPRAVELWLLRMKWGFRSMNRAYHSHTNSYDVF